MKEDFKYKDKELGFLEDIKKIMILGTEKSGTKEAGVIQIFKRDAKGSTQMFSMIEPEIGYSEEMDVEEGEFCLVKPGTYYNFEAT